MKAPLKRGSLRQRLFARCTPNENGCIEWNGPVLNSGYGHIRVGGKHEGKVLAHRAAWILQRGDIPNGQYVLHSCANKRCVNVQHLRLGTQLDNMADEKKRGRRLGAAPKLPSCELPRLAILRTEGWTQQAIADHYGVSRPLISLLLSGKLQRAPDQGVVS